MRPYDDLPTRVEYGGKIYRLELSYPNFFLVSDLLQDDTLTDLQKVQTALDIFVRGRHPDDTGLLKSIYNLIKEDRPTPPQGPKTMDVVQDWSYICAGFMQAYGIDLYADKRMHILKFQHLLQGLPSSTKLAEIIKIRATPLPEPGKHNGKEIAELSKLKAQYALRPDGPGNYDTGVAELYDLLEATANAGKWK